MTDRKTRLYIDLAQILLWLSVFMAFAVAFFFLSGNMNPSIWISIKSSVQSLFFPFVIYLINYYILIPRCFYAGKRGLFLLLNLAIIVLIIFVPLLFSSPAQAFEEARIEEAFEGFSIWKFLIGVVVIRILLYLCVIGLALGMKYMIRWFEERKNLEEERRRNTEAELNWLKNQLNPHFLFNTLNNISSLVQIDADKAQESIAQLSELLRYALYESNCSKVKASDEVAFMRNYIDLMSLRCSDKTRVEVRFDDFDDSVQISPLLFISLVENAFKHGASAHLDSFVKMEMGLDGDDVIFSCENSIVPKKTQDYSGSGVGLENLRRRLELLYPGRHSFESFTEGEIYVVVVRIKNVRSDE